jgi:N-dimethylarginine dimethylaminohydrolase
MPGADQSVGKATRPILLKGVTLSHMKPERTAREQRQELPRRYLMCRPVYFDVTYSINPWMDPDRPTSMQTGLGQWKGLFDTFVGLGHDVRLIEPIPGLPDMVFAANGALVVDGKVLVARFRYPQRRDESKAYLEWFRLGGWSTVRQAEYVNEREGDFLFTGGQILAGAGSRSESRADDEVREFLGLPVISLTLVDPRFYP